ncbi:Guanine nucleotide-binding protein subunit beta-1 [Hondaea fermentalgiana]|uniref:Guanine nucleotide-binding protein subunit beta-1 n=1 Tax=Hondaea fermentalgiana TaxID=2315210 RepID=A0A2R5GAA0_9STRA|nr:Guanine nucleotide-binding protein subunit beta-1 [Hondaea fermentalgiana]|eukprot:GBG27515.1 Guanine nucleotide-binding protein subunit beta-1 [Hondaea fermentalgiana]
MLPTTDTNATSNGGTKDAAGVPPALPAGGSNGAAAQAADKIAALKGQIEAELASKTKGTSAEEWWRDNQGGRPFPPQPKQPQVLRILKGHFGKVYSMHWAGDNKHLVSASQDGKLIVWNAATTNRVQAIPLRSSWVMTCAYEQSRDQLVACGGLDNICSVYKLSSEGGLGVTRAYRELSGHDGYLSSCRFAGPSQIISSSGDSTCMQWDVETGIAMRTFSDHAQDVMSVAVSPTQPHLFASGSIDATARIYDTRAAACAITFTGHESDINSVSFFPDGNAIGTGSDDSTCKLFDVRACREIASYGNDSIVCGITAVDFSVSGRILFAGYDDFAVYGWDVTNRDKPMMLKLHENRIACLQVNLEGSALGTGSWDTLLKVSG